VASAPAKFPEVVAGLVRILRSISDMVRYLSFIAVLTILYQKQRLQPFQGQPEFERNYIDSQATTLDTLNKCFAVTPVQSTFIADDTVVRLLVLELLKVSEVIFLM